MSGEFDVSGPGTGTSGPFPPPPPPQPSPSPHGNPNLLYAIPRLSPIAIAIADDEEEEEKEEEEEGEGDKGRDNLSRPVPSITCQDCGNQAKKDCMYLRCRTCCKGIPVPDPREEHVGPRLEAARAATPPSSSLRTRANHNAAAIRPALPHGRPRLEAETEAYGFGGPLAPPGRSS